MTRNADELSPINDERLERLMCRSLDGAITPDEQSELDRRLTEDPRARALFDEYLHNDQLVSSVLRRDFEIAMTAAAPRHRRGMWLATAAGVLAAAAVIALSVLATLDGPTPIVDRRPLHRADDSFVPARLVDYRDRGIRNVDYQPYRRQRGERRDLLGVRGDDKDVIYIFERQAETSKLVPISGDF